MRKFLLPYLFLILLSCSKTENVRKDSDPEYVDVTVSVSVADELAVWLGVKSDSDSQVNESEIKNLWILQYAGDTDNAQNVGNPFYVEDFSKFDGIVSMVSTPVGIPTTIVFIANTFEKNFSGFNTLGEIKSRIKDVTEKDAVLTTDGSGKQYIIFSAISEVNTGLVVGGQIDAILERNVAKVNINVLNQIPDNVTIESVQLCSVPNVSYYVIDPEAEQFPSEKVAAFINMDPVSWAADNSSYTYYLPVNIRGKVDNVSELSKNRHAPFDATYVKVIAKYKEDDSDVEHPVSYKFYLGENMYDDFNLEPNHFYTYTFNISSIGNSEADSRVEKWDSVDYTDPRYESSNCYILNPAPNMPRRFKIPIQQLKTFWGTEKGYKYENDVNYSLRGNAEWKAWVIASDFILQDKFSFVKENGNSEEDTYFEVEIAPGVEGNVIVAVGPKEGVCAGEISWSWHLWITDYNPYACMDYGDGLDGRYIYPVDNGDVHRYEGVYWTYNKSHYIMDRNLGAYSVDYPEDKMSGLLYYQYGRKDPFFFVQRRNNAYKTGAITSEVYEKANETNAQLYSIHNPLTFIKTAGNNKNNGTWIADDKYNPGKPNSSLIWNDPLTVRGGIREGEKSIFDPCPPGFRLPDKTIWSDFMTNDTGKTTNAFKSKGADMQREFDEYAEVLGLQYWPYQGDGAKIPSQVIYYPSCGMLLPNEVYVAQDKLYVDANINSSSSPLGTYSWADFTFGKEQSYSMLYTEHLNGTSTSFNVKNASYHARALPVRCITDK